MALSMDLTDIAVRKAKPGEKPYKLTDGHGLFLLVQPSGGKLWHYKYSFGAKEKLIALGPYPDVTLAAARERHQQARRLLDSGIDPMEQRKAKKAAEKTNIDGAFGNVAALWLEHWREGQTVRHMRGMSNGA